MPPHSISVFYENRFADSLRTCYSVNRFDTIKEAQADIEAMRKWDKEWRPNHYYVIFDGRQISVDDLMRM